MTAKQLTDSILQLAIQGKLVPQDPNDEPASVLLDRIREEKKRLVKEGKLKKSSLKEVEINADDIPFDIPETWVWVRLRDIVSILGDGLHGTPQYDPQGTYFFINGNNLNNNKIVIKPNTERVNEGEYLKYKKELSEKTILVSINGTIGNVGHYSNEPVMLGKSACYFNLVDINCKQYITKLMYTDYFLKYAKDNATGSTIKNVSLEVMNNFLVPLPPIGEQRRIVEKLDGIIPLTKEYGSAYEEGTKLNAELPEKLKKSILQEAIMGKLGTQDPNDEPASALLDRIREEKKALVKAGILKKKDLVETPISDDDKPFDIPENWEWVRMSSLCSLITKGTTPRGGNVAYLDKGIGFLRAENVSGIDKISKINLKYIDQETNDGFLKRSILKENDVLITIAGTLGRTAIVRKSDLPLNANQAISLCRFVDIIKIDLTYIVFALNAPEIQRMMLSLKKITAIPNLTLEIISDTMVPLPPLAEQHRIVEKIEALFAEVDHIEI